LALTKQQLGFLQTVTQPALDNERVFGIPACITIAQAIFESASPTSGWGGSVLFRLANNPFGIKFSDRSPDAKYGHFDVETYEVIHGQREEVPAEFQKFPNLREAFTAHCLLLMTPWYRAAYAERGNWQHFAALLGPKNPENPSACGYSTEPEYAARLIAAVKDYRLDDPRALAWYAEGKDPGPQIAPISQTGAGASGLVSREPASPQPSIPSIRIYCDPEIGQ
jgi:flagellum-specific peptidoglycan hydrolase FlgJ